MSLADLARQWDAFGRRDPLWAILTLPGKQGGGWSREEFLATGRAEAARVAALLDRLGLPSRRRRALDFGCGVGRVTQGLADHFDEVDGVDVAGSMVEIARSWNAHGDRCRYHVLATGDLAPFGDATFDLAYSSYVLQHVPPPLAWGYVGELVRVLSPGGLALFQLPAEPRPGASAPLHTGAFRAAVLLPRDPLRAPAGSGLKLPVRVTNLGDAAWPERGDGTGAFRVSVGNHWRSADGALLSNDDGRARLPHDVAPGETVEVLLPVTVPVRPGAYVLEVDVVQEGVAWFAERGSATARLAAEAEEGSVPADEADREEAAPRMEMHGAPREEVARWVAAAGGRLLGTFPPVAEGHEFLERDWVSYLYAVTR